MDNENVYPGAFERKIGFESVRRCVSERCVSSLGASLVEDMCWQTDAATVRRLLEETAEMVAVEASGGFPGLGDLADPAPWLLPARVEGSFIEGGELALLRGALATAGAIRAFLAAAEEGEHRRWPRLSVVAEGLDDVPEVARAINAVIDGHGQVRDNASAELADIRSQLGRIGGRIASAMRRVVAEGIREGYLEADTTPSVRDGRLVIPVAPMNKRRLSGIVHDESASGKTFFIEPAEVVELNNRQRELEIEERREVVRILTEVTAQIRPHIAQLLTTYDTLGVLDFIGAKARFARDVRAAMPRLSERAELEWYGARHPVLQMKLERQGRGIVPLNIELKAPDRRILIISGPNAGGKSVALKTVGIVQYMAQCGLLPTLYEGSVMCVMDGIFADIGDDQSIEDDLSTYSSHLRNMKHFLRNGGRRTLMLIDEFGAGTEPQIGGAIAQALLTRFNDLGMWGVITTHYQNLKTLAEETPGLVNGSMLYDREKMQPLFALSPGHPGSSFALEIARKTGLPPEVIRDAEAIVGSDYVNLDKYLLDIARDKRYWENKRERVRRREKHLEEVIERYENDAEALRSSRRALLEEARKQAEEIIAGSNAEIERTIHDIRRAQADREATQQARLRLRRQREALAEEGAKDDVADDNPLLRKAPKARRKKAAPATPTTEKRQLAPGDNVLLDGAGQPGTVVELQGKKAVVNFGAMKMTVAAERLVPTLRKAQSGLKAASFVSAATTDDMRSRQLSFKPEIDVRGMRADEALQAVTYFMDDAVQFNAGRVRILHGTGTGALRMAIRQYLATLPAVRVFHDEDVRFGGAGITVAELS